MGGRVDGYTLHHDAETHATVRLPWCDVLYRAVLYLVDECVFFCFKL